jgi:hypothetical protein
MQCDLEEKKSSRGDVARHFSALLKVTCATDIGRVIRMSTHVLHPNQRSIATMGAARHEDRFVIIMHPPSHSFTLPVFLTIRKIKR